MKTKDKHKQALIEAVKLGESNTILSLAVMGGDINVVDDNGNTLMMIAIQNGHGKLCYTLAPMGVDLKAENKHGDTTLSLAIKHRCKELVFFQAAGAK